MKNPMAPRMIRKNVSERLYKTVCTISDASSANGNMARPLSSRRRESIAGSLIDQLLQHLEGTAQLQVTRVDARLGIEFGLIVEIDPLLNRPLNQNIGFDADTVD